MTNVDRLNVVAREERGSNAVKKLRAKGLIPAVLYGHGEPAKVLSAKASDIDKIIRHGGRLVDLTGAVSESALIKQVDWDPFGNHILHLDFARVSKSESVEITVQIELRGEAPGTKEGGVIIQPQHEVEIICPVTAIPEKIEVNINTLELDQAITAGDLELPLGAKLITDPTVVIVECTEPAEVPEEEEIATEGAEPEVIGGRPESEDSDES